jgi:hypothetical protein
MSEQLWIKIETTRRGRRLKDLADILGMPSSDLSQYVRGFRHVPAGFESRVLNAFRLWDTEKAQSISSKIQAVRSMTAGRVQG